MKLFLHNLRQRIQSMREGRRDTAYKIQADDTALTLTWLTMENTRGSDQLPWNEVKAVIVFKRDLFAVDCICMAFEDSEHRYREINEEMDGWQQTIDSLPKHLPGIKPFHEWFMDVAMPPFAQNKREIFRRNDGPT